MTFCWPELKLNAPSYFCATSSPETNTYALVSTCPSMMIEAGPPCTVAIACTAASVESLVLGGCTLNLISR